MNQIRSMFLIVALLISMDHKVSVKASRGCVCPEIFAPVCGSDGQTYPNACFLGCEKHVTEVSEGECQTPALDCVCTDQYEPVCGSDGVTYGNICEFNCSAGENTEIPCVEQLFDCRQHQYVYVVSDGECSPDEICFCPQVVDQVCGTDGKDYLNECYAICAGVYVKSQGPCPTGEPPGSDDGSSSDSDESSDEP